jgi:hypothetical protein
MAELAAEMPSCDMMVQMVESIWPFLLRSLFPGIE